MSRLVSFGCSHTYGVGLPDCYNKGKTSTTPSKSAWPQVVADSLNIECRNMSIPGSSNKKILHNLLSFNFLNTDIVLILWSYPERSCIINDDFITDIMPFSKTKLEKMYYKYFFNDTDNHFNDRVYKELAYFYLNSIALTAKHFSVVPVDQNMNFIENTFFDNYSHYGKALDGCHHSQKGQYLFAMEVLRTLHES